MQYPMSHRGFSAPHYDAIIIGGGITGASIAYELSLKGASVALLEKSDFGSGTSAATSKLIHGGLRYLKNLEVGLVRESLRERRYLSDIAPNFVRPIPFMLPYYSLKEQLMLKAGMEAYDYLSFDKQKTKLKENALPNYQTLSRRKTMIREKTIHEKGLMGSYIYYDCQNAYAERLTLNFIKSAMLHDAEVSNYCKVTDFKVINNVVKGIEAFDLIHQQKVKLNGTVVINCAGAWANSVLQLEHSPQRKNIPLRSEGIHIVTPSLGNKHAVALVTPKGRHIMLLPWRGHTIIGTTDKPYKGEVDEWDVTQESIDELIEEVNACYGNALLTKEDITYYYGGLRPLVDQNTENTYDQSRKHEIVDHASEGFKNLLTVEGGKYTTSRHLAELLGEKISSVVDLEKKHEQTAKQPLFGCGILHIENYKKYLMDEFPKAIHLQIDTLVNMYGEEAKEILDIHFNSNSENLSEEGEVTAQIHYAIKNEMAFTLEDLFLRRTGLGTLRQPSDVLIQKVSLILKEKLNYSEEQLIQQKENLLNHYRLIQNQSKRNENIA
ncbi:glycerol-3-phosphate dehydrogenase/oxidase [Flammeovirga aprica]|uniref:Glycerol-3-phosphate dehydrogenase/oxidase n=1 Tax=Flammeovirga aprica JL-4 TaxID=694437 RepID=A0A7X9P048_9BACT|nr:glycerol-3-phosphate dehydrogenase/oxidase [Flammeovirga aprica]NME66875.1 glycerol-3-phosphate dehydrogenase/oxidase [Flammeovirga aprica JL-4]